ncbi:MAG TPA: hypothetical protein VMV97_00450 [Sulfuriferula sp.]|nr:hypothetical protein [Sulfuriferula sp.]
MTQNEKKLLQQFRGLTEKQRETLLDFAAFLAARGEVAAAAEPIQPLPMERPAQESVVKAIKRLMATYPMLERNKLLHETSNQMTRHVIHGIPAVTVIDDLEVLFRRHYEMHIAPSEKD